MNETVILFRPVGTKELDLVEASDFTTFPPRLPEQPIFYPVTNEQYATQIARDWNAKYNADKIGYVTKFAVRKKFLDSYEKKIVGGTTHEEYWIPAEDLEEFNRNIVGKIEIILEFKGIYIVPAKDLFHDNVRRALEKDGWTITADPYTLVWGKESLFVDLAAGRFIAAERENEKIAVEIKSFTGRSQTAELEKALGQFSLYYSVMQRANAERKLYLAVPETVFGDLFEGEKGEIVMSDERLRVFCFSVESEVITKWKR